MDGCNPSIILLFSVPVSAHVTVKPTESAAGSWETYTVKVPVEKDNATIKVVLSMPDGVEFQQYEPVPGWKTSTETGKTKSNKGDVGSRKRRHSAW